jgi:hypothetical protein
LYIWDFWKAKGHLIFHLVSGKDNCHWVGREGSWGQKRKQKKTKQNNPSTFCLSSMCSACSLFSVNIHWKKPIREELKLHWEHPPGCPRVMNGGWESFWTPLAEVWPWALQQEVILCMPPGADVQRRNSLGYPVCLEFIKSQIRSFLPEAFLCH